MHDSVPAFNATNNRLARPHPFRSQRGKHVLPSDQTLGPSLVGSPTGWMIRRTCSEWLSGKSQMYERIIARDKPFRLWRAAFQGFLIIYTAIHLTEVGALHKDVR
ncbi:hypothetical protein BDW02DRAFT_294467 [Decorospora gaudefroyi]|uniref:Uncharacterized protein n=1 Tax=Decorospora gaudefroyi TaxID=184978 RepID=A0A6A5KHZ5_9PLEO|nr:hypothetical protein BDW02DRAFT_294467 [Decorospora gaudefroyi]